MTQSEVTFCSCKNNAYRALWKDLFLSSDLILEDQTWRMSSAISLSVRSSTDIALYISQITPTVLDFSKNESSSGTSPGRTRAF